VPDTSVAHDARSRGTRKESLVRGFVRGRYALEIEWFFMFSKV